LVPTEKIDSLEFKVARYVGEWQVRWCEDEVTYGGLAGIDSREPGGVARLI
jgi:hypothetical protein